MKIIFLSLVSSLLLIQSPLHAQTVRRLSDKLTLGYHPNIETYFIAEKLAVQKINTFVFDQKDSLYAHQPLVYFAYQHFKKYGESPCILRISELMKSLRDSFHDNAEILQFLLSKKPFPAKGDAYPFADSAIFHLNENPMAMTMVSELADSLRSFYIQAKVGDFLNQNKSFYNGALNEVQKDLRVSIFSFMEKYYGEQFYQYNLFIMPLMPITVGDDNYRAFGPAMHLPGGRVSAMVFSSSRMLPLQKSLKEYKKFGFDNPEITHFLTVHEIGHSFVNPHVLPMKEELDHDTALFTPALQKALEPSYISNWQICVIEHLVRLGEIRIAVNMKDTAEATRLRALHVNGFKFVLLPLLEKKMEEYEANRGKYPDFNSFLPQLFSFFHSLKPAQVDELVASLSAK